MDNMNTGNLGIMAGIVISLGFFAMIFGIVYLYKRERMAMIERAYQNLKWGLLLIGAGLGLFLAFVLDHTCFSNIDEGIQAIYFSLIAIFGGLGLFASFLIEKKQVLDKEDK
jgi:hypothetical protein